MTNNEVHDRVVEWLNGLLGVPVIKDRQGIDRPAQPYGMVDLANWRELSRNLDNLQYNDPEEPQAEATITIGMEWTFLFFVYGAQGETLVRRLQSAVHMLSPQDFLRPELIIHEVSGANSIPEFVGETWEPRTQVNIVVRGNTIDTLPVDDIDAASVSFNFTGERA